MEQINKQELEDVVLSAIYSDEEKKYTDFDIIQEKYFSDINKSLYKKLKEFRTKKLPPDTVISKEYFTGEEVIKLTINLSKVSHACFLPNYFNMLKKEYLRQEGLKVTEEYNKTGIIDILKLQEIVREYLNTDKINVSSLSDNSQNYIDNLNQRITGEVKTYRTYYPKLDNIIGKLYPGTSIIIGGKTSLGKTSLLLNIAYQTICNNIPVLFLSAEMSFIQLVDRMVSARTRVNLYHITNAELNDTDKNRIIDVISGDMSELPFYVYETSKFSEHTIQKLIDKYQPEVVFVDYIQRFSLPTEYDTRASAFGEIANNLKSLAIDNKIVIFSASQLSRQTKEKQEHKKVKLEDLKESSGIEQSADIVILLEEITEVESSKTVLLKIAKNRTGRTGEISFDFQKEFCEFTE